MPTPITALGFVHTAASLMAIGSAVVCFVRAGAITPRSTAGLIYIGATLVTTVTALWIFQHGGFGPGHALAILTLVALAIGLVCSWSAPFGRLTRAVQTAAFSSTLLFHAIPGVTEALTRLPPDAPVFASAQAPQFKPIYAVLLVLFVVGLVFQLRRQHKS